MPRPTIREVLVVLIAITLSACLTLVITRWTDGVQIDWHLTSETVAHFATIIGVLIAGWWALYTAIHRRALVPRAELKHRYEFWSNSKGLVLRIYVELNNSSEAMMRPGDGMTYVQTPSDDDLESSVYAEDQWIEITAIRHASCYEDIMIEPKETEAFVHDVQIPKGVRYIQIHSWLICQRTKQFRNASDEDERPTDEIQRPDEDICWSLTTMIDLASRNIP